MGHTPHPRYPQNAVWGEQHGHTCVSADSSMLQKMPNCLKFPVLRVRSSMTAKRGRYFGQWQSWETPSAPPGSLRHSQVASNSPLHRSAVP